ncbi:MAG: hypothetical protein HGA39_06650 [Coriobacteriia bacterium]|nr:hypothetical protein [Coriobacteriia bacterium]
MTTDLTSFRLPEPVVTRLSALGDAERISAAVNTALASILAAEPDDRVAMMRDALPLMDGPLTETPALALDSATLEAFNAYCAEKGLKRDVIVAGALRRQLAM